MSKIQENMAKTQQTNVLMQQKNVVKTEQKNVAMQPKNVSTMQENVVKTEQKNVSMQQNNMAKMQKNVLMQQNNMVKMQENVAMQQENMAKSEQNNVATIQGNVAKTQQKNVAKTQGKNRVKTFGMAALALMLGLVTILGTACSNSAGGGAKSSINTDNSAPSAQTVQTISGESYTPKSTDPAVYTTTEGHQVFRSEAGINYINYGGSTYEIVAQGAYTPIEYIEGTADEVESGKRDAARGHQFINTGYFSNPLTDTIEIKYLYTDLDHEGIICGYSSATSTRPPREDWYKFFEDHFTINIENASTPKTTLHITSSVMDTNVHTIKRDKEKIYVDGSLKGSLDTSLMIPTRATIPFGLFGRTQNAAGTSWNYGPKMRMYTCKIWDNGTLVRDYIPVKNINGEPGLYDRVHNIFYGSVTGTPFIAGPEISYTSIDYIESNGNQYIDTGVVYKTKPRVDTTFYRTSTADLDILGTANTGTPFIVDYKNSNGYARYGSTTYQTYTSVAPNQWVTASYSNQWIENGTVKKTFTGYDFSANTQSIYLFSSQRGNRGWVRLKETKIWDNDVLLRDFVPCKYQGEVGLFDRVNNKFYGSATGTPFLAPTTETSYTELEYAESTGAQYINTGFYHNIATSTIELSYQLTSLPNKRSAIGGALGGGGVEYWQYYFDGNPPCVEFTYHSPEGTYPGLKTSPDTQKHTLRRDKRNVYFDGNTQTYQYPASTNFVKSAVPFGLFACSNQGYLTGDRRGFVKIFYCKMWENDILVRDFVPAKRNSDNVAGLYDKVTRQFYPSQTSTALVAGPVRATTVTQHVDNSPAGLAIANDPNAGSRKIAPVAGIPINDSIPVGHFLCQRPDGTQILIKL